MGIWWASHALLSNLQHTTMRGFNAGDLSRIIVHNHKGGTGKTMTAVHLANYLARRGLDLCVWDADRQNNAINWLTEYQWDGSDTVRLAGEGQAEVVATIRQETALGQNRSLIIDTPPTDGIVRDLLEAVELGEKDMLVCPTNGRLAVGGAVKVAEEVAETGCRLVLLPNMTDPKDEHAQTEIQALEELAALDRVGAEVFQLAIPWNDRYMRRAEEQGVPIWDLSHADRTHTGKALRAFCEWIARGAPPEENPPTEKEPDHRGPISEDLQDRLWN